LTCITYVSPTRAVSGVKPCDLGYEALRRKRGGVRFGENFLRVAVIFAYKDLVGEVELWTPVRLKQHSRHVEKIQ